MKRRVFVSEFRRRQNTPKKDTDIDGNNSKVSQKRHAKLIENASQKIHQKSIEKLSRNATKSHPKREENPLKNVTEKTTTKMYEQIMQKVAQMEPRWGPNGQQSANMIKEGSGLNSVVAFWTLLQDFGPRIGSQNGAQIGPKSM